MRQLTPLILLAAALVAPLAPAATPKEDPAIAAAIDSPDRPAADKQRDEGRRPAIVLQFLAVKPGQTLIEYIATGGNTAELLARVVGPKGKVYMQNPPEWLNGPTGPGGKPPAQQIEERLANNRLPNVARLEKPLDDLGLAPASVDGAVMNLVFHDMFWITKDNVAPILKNLYTTLKPGGFVGVIDHAAPAGTGSEYAKNRAGQHRIDEDLVKKMFKEAGFELQKESDALRNPEDDRQKPFFSPDIKGKYTDRFMLRFVKPKH
jgi:predicted methyltransferase